MRYTCDSTRLKLILSICYKASVQVGRQQNSISSFYTEFGTYRRSSSVHYVLSPHKVTWNWPRNFFWRCICGVEYNERLYSTNIGVSDKKIMLKVVTNSRNASCGRTQLGPIKSSYTKTGKSTQTLHLTLKL